MNNPNPFVPKGALLGQQDKRRKHMKIGVYCVLTFGVASLMVMLIQGCKQKTSDQPLDTSMPAPSTNDVAGTGADTNTPPPDTNLGTVTPPTNIVTSMNPGTPVGTPIATAPQSPIPATPPPVNPITPVANPVPTAPPDAGSGEYTVVKGDSLAKIAKKNGVTLKALEAANPDVKPTKLKINQKLVIPAGGKTIATDATAAPMADQSTEATTESYTVKSGDTLTKIAKAHHVKVKALQAANGLTTTKIKVGEKLKLPARAESATTAAAPVEPAAVPETTTSAPPMPAVNMTAPNPSAAPAAH